MRNIPTVTKNLLIINFLAFLAMIALKPAMGVDLNDLLGLHFFMASDFHIYQLFTYMFMHAGWEHIIMNMFMLWMFGAVIERTFGEKRFLFYYIFCGLGAGILQEISQYFYVYFLLNNQQPLSLADSFAVMQQLSERLNSLTTVGASGAIYALLLAFGMLFPNEKLFIIPIPIPIKAKWMVLASIVIEFVSAWSVSSNVAHLAHLGGMLFGFFLIRYWQKHPNSYEAVGKMDAKRFFSRMQDKWEQKTHGTSGKDAGNWDQERDTDWNYNARRKAEQEEIDHILDKIRRSGYDSLTKEEKQKLFDQSKK